MENDLSPEDVRRSRGALIERYGPGEQVPAEHGRPLLPVPIVSAADFATVEVPRRCFLDGAGLFPQRNVTILSGDGGTGKSLLALQLAASVAVGEPWLGIHVKQGPVLYLSAEDDSEETHIRLTEICQAENLDLGRMRNLELCLLAGEEAVLAAEATGSSEIKLTSLFLRLRLRLSICRPMLLVLDNLADVFAGNENVRPLVRQFIGALRKLAMEFDCAVLLLAHPSLSGLTNGSGTSGSTAWNNSVRSRLYLSRKSDSAEGDDTYRILKTMKANYGPAGGLIPLRWQAGRFIRTDTAGSSLDATAKAQKSARVYLAALRWHIDKNQPVSPSKSPTYAPALFARHHMNEGLTSRDFEVAQSILLDQNQIRIIEEGCASRRRRRIVPVNKN